MIPHVIVVGGGITGLSCAYFLKQAAEQYGIEVRVTLFEKNKIPGGKIRTVNQQGFLIETGADSFQAKHLAGPSLCEEIGLGDELLRSNAQHQNFYILHQNRLVRFPSDFHLFIPRHNSALLKTSLLSFPGKIRAFCERWVKVRMEEEDESIASFVSRRFGTEFLSNIAAPIMTVPYGGDPSKWSMQVNYSRYACLEREAGSLTQGVKHLEQVKPESFSLRSGLSTFTNRMAEILEKEIQLGLRVNRLDMLTQKFQIHTEDMSQQKNCYPADVVVLCTPAHETWPILADEYPELAAPLSALTSISSITVSLGYLKEDAFKTKTLKGSGFFPVYGQDIPFCACSWSSNKFEGRSDDNHFLFRIFFAGLNLENWLKRSDEELVDSAETILRKYIGITSPSVINLVSRWENGTPQYTIKHAKLMTKIEDFLTRVPGLYLAGESYRGSNISNCIQDAARTAMAVAKSLI